MIAKLIEWALAVWALGKLLSFALGACVIVALVAGFAYVTFADWLAARRRKRGGW